MRVILRPDVFASPRTPELMVFLWLGASLRHRVVIEDEGDAGYLAWLGTLDPITRQDWERTTKDGLEQGEVSPSRYDVHVTGQGTSRWSGDSPTLTVAAALDFLQRPYRVLVENGYSDAAFLVCVCDPETRSFIEERIDREWLEMEHCGGNTHMEKRVKSARRSPSTRMRCSAVFDGDALRPGKPSPQSETLRNLCVPDLHHHQLQRRAIENYIPRAALEKWCKKAQGGARENRRRRVEAYLAMTGPQQAHYNMKEGFSGDEKNTQKAGDLYAKLPAEARSLLDEGFGKDIASLYLDKYVHHADLERTSSVAAVQAFAREIVERVR